MSELVSVIIPVYNMEKYLDECISSAVNQTYGNIEIILIDDGSTDNSGDICDRYEKKDSRIKVIHKKNEGLVCARQTGFENSSGEYIMPLDADDWLDIFAVEKMVEKFSEDVDVVLSNVIDVVGKQKHLRLPDSEEGVYGIYQGSYIWNNLFVCSIDPTKRGIRSNIWSRMFKRQLYGKWQNQVPKNITNGEDDAAFFPMILDSKSIYIMEKGLYYCRNREESMSRAKENIRLSQLVELEDYLGGIIERKWPGQVQFFCDYMKIRFNDYSRVKYGDNKNSPGCSGAFINMYYVPYEKMPAGKKVIIYGAGRVGNSYFKQLKENKYSKIVARVDEKGKKIEGVISVDEGLKLDYDYILIATAKIQYMEEIRDNLLKKGVPYNKIIDVIPYRSNGFFERKK